MGPEPDTVVPFDVIDQSFEDAHARTVPNDVRVHGHEKQPLLRVGSIQLRLKDFENIE